MMEQPEEKRALLRLFFAQGIGRIYQRRILEQLGGGWEKSPRLSFLEGVPSRIFQSLQNPSLEEQVEKELRWLEDHRARIVSILDHEYPPLLRHISDAPPILFVKGSFSDWENHLPLAFVGTRNATDYGQKVVESLIGGLSGMPVVVVSGFARGVDAFAHRAALKAGIPTVGVLGTGLDFIYPKENETLHRLLLEKGAFLTEYTTQTPPHAGHFPERNRIISGVSRAVVLVETPEESGALITAQFALEQGREVLAVPGNIFSPNNRGCHRLIGQGAKLIGTVEDLLEELKLWNPKKFGTVSLQKEAKPPLDSSETRLLESLSFEPLHIDKITEISNLAPSLVAGTLIAMVLKGWVEELPGKFFVRV